MKSITSKTTPVAAMIAVLSANASAFGDDATHSTPSPLEGVWTLVAAEVLHPDGSVENDYGASPKGMLIVDAEGRYSLQIMKSERKAFVSASKAEGTPEEFKQAVMGSSTHFGTVRANLAERTLSFAISGSSFPNWEGQIQTRSYEHSGNVLTYKVPPRPNGDVPISTWRRQ